jgi:hypothetical protein
MTCRALLEGRKQPVGQDSLAATGAGERQLAGVIFSDDRFEVASSQEWLSVRVPYPTAKTSDSKADSCRWNSTAVKPDPSTEKASDAAAVALNRGAFDRQTALFIRAATRSL